MTLRVTRYFIIATALRSMVANFAIADCLIFRQ